MVAMSPNGGKLVRATTRGAPYGASDVNYAALAAASNNVGDTTIRVDDSGFANTIPTFYIFPSAGNPQSIHGPYFGVATADPFVIKLNVALVQNVRVGDIVAAVPFFQLIGSGNHVQADYAILASDRFVPVQGGTATGVQHIWAAVDNNGQVTVIVRDQGMPLNSIFGFSFTTAVTPSVTFGAITGTAYQVDVLGASIRNRAAVAYGTTVTMAEIPALATSSWSEDIAIPAVTGSAYGFRERGLKIPVTKGSGFSVAFGDVLPANVQASIVVGIYKN